MGRTNSRLRSDHEVHPSSRHRCLCQYFTGETKKVPNRRSYSSGFTSGYASSSAYTSGTAAPTAAPTQSGSTTITQKVTMDFPGLADHTAYAASSFRTVANFGYGKALGIVTQLTTGTQGYSYIEGNSVDSTAAASRRAAMAVTFTAYVAPAQAQAASANANSISAASLTTDVQAVLTHLKTRDHATYGALNNPTVSAVTPPTVTTASGSASTTATLSAVAFVAAALALKQ